MQTRVGRHGDSEAQKRLRKAKNISERIEFGRFGVAIRNGTKTAQKKEIAVALGKEERRRHPIDAPGGPRRTPRCSFCGLEERGFLPILRLLAHFYWARPGSQPESTEAEAHGAVESPRRRAQLHDE
ncbi:hypothetical protein L596_008032 [Steinernema carpocapsae]|uniref:Uncharacterized protein n=1 Tax=Steinernema carpocapsae TaxID=34508 RepID=A0A4U5PBH3_STECR|nr:hypothetical protein L596_008032 [Steinernema carpocapsae]